MAGSAAGWVVVTAAGLALPQDGALIGLAFLLALAFYTRDRLNRQEQLTDRLTMPDRTAWLEKRAGPLQWLVRGSFVVVGLLVALRPAAAWPLLAGLGFALSYTLRWLPWGGRRVAWKQLPAMKMPLVAALWSLTTVIVPAGVYDRLWLGQTWRLIGAVWLLIMGQILLNDLRDITADRAGGTLSLPVLVGPTAARRIGGGLAGLAVWLAWPVEPLPFLVTGLYTLFLLWRYHRAHDARWRFWIEAQGLLAAALALVKPSACTAIWDHFSFGANFDFPFI